MQPGMAGAELRERSHQFVDALFAGQPSDEQQAAGIADDPQFCADPASSS